MDSILDSAWGYVLTVLSVSFVNVLLMRAFEQQEHSYIMLLIFKHLIKLSVEKGFQVYIWSRREEYFELTSSLGANTSTSYDVTTTADIKLIK